MKRYNQIGGPYPVEECADGHWVTYEDYNLSELTHNKDMEKSYNRYVTELSNAAYKTDSSVEDKLDQLRLTVIVMSVIIFGGVAGFIFSWM